MKVDDIIVLENQERYILLAETSYENQNYFLAAAIDEQENIDQKKLVLLKHVEEVDGSYVEIVKNEDLLIKLTNQLKDAIK